jgi:hypothetical protein
MKNERWGKEPKSKDRPNFKDGQLEELRRRWEALPDGVKREEVKAQLTEWSQFQPAQPRNKY